jgi:hypothetical protein
MNRLRKKILAELFFVEFDVSFIILFCSFEQHLTSNLALWATRETEKDLRKNKDLYVKTTLRELVIYLVFIAILCISKYKITFCFMKIVYVNKRQIFMVEFYIDKKRCRDITLFKSSSVMYDLSRCLLNVF